VQFGIMMEPHIDKCDMARYAEELGFDRVNVPDSQMIWSDPYPVLALAAVNTKRIWIGTGITSPELRIAPVTANAIATINQLAPGRVFLGMGTGHTSVRLIGRKPASVARFREYLNVVRKLLDGEEVDYPDHGERRLIKFMHRERRYINLDDRIPIIVAANGPKAISLAGEVADGWTISTTRPEMGKRAFAHLHEGAKIGKRELPAAFYASFQTCACVLRSGESLTSERVIDEVGSYVTTILHLTYEVWRTSGQKIESVPPFFHNIWEDYLKRVASFTLPPEARFRQIHHGHSTFLQPEERRFITPETIRGTCLAGEPDEIIARIRAMERVGFKGLNLLPAADYARNVFRDFAEYIIPAFR
jgi:alkanesulfonate monooxygenase SsuD/methylene tetrahydromethanopterin reductase-like flavin-dependent oxidoreductase (luciferase family)